MDVTNRRPLGARSWRISQHAARWLSRTKITPNQISLASIAFAAMAGVCLINLPGAGTIAVWELSFLAVLFILCRALCNMLDGMVAVEGGKQTRSGELFNDIPDRISDPLIIVSAGYATTITSWAPELGWGAGLLAVMTAYVRTLARSIGAPSDFRGPMSKVPRMMLVAIAAILTPIESLFWPQGTLLFGALLIIAAGCVVTIGKRAYAAFLYLEGKAGA